MKKAFLLMVIFALVVGCAGVPVRNSQFTESNLPRQYYIEGIKPIKGDLGFFHWVTCVDMVLNFYGRPLEKETKDKAIARVRANNITAGFYGLGLGPQAALSAAFAAADGIKGSTSPDYYYPTALGLHGFKRYSFYDESPDGTKIKYLLAQGHPVMVIHRFGPLTNPVDWKNISYVLLIGYDDGKEIFLLCDPRSGEAFEMPYRDFPRRQAIEWADTSKLVRSGEIIYPKK